MRRRSFLLRLLLGLRVSPFSVSCVKDLSRDEGRVEGLGEAAVHGCVQERFDDFFTRQSDVERSTDVHLELRLAPTKGGEHAESDQLPAARIEAGAVIE